MSDAEEPIKELPTSFAVGDQLDWQSQLIDVHLVVELPFFLMMESARVDLEVRGMPFELLVSDQDVEVFIDEFRDSRVNCGYQGNNPRAFEERDDVKESNLKLFRRRQRTTVYMKARALSDVLESVFTQGPKNKVSYMYLETLCEAHVLVLNELIRRYRLLTYDYFAYEVSAWDVPVWHIRGGPPGHVSVPLFNYAELDSRPWIFPNLLKKDLPEEQRQEKSQLSLVSGADIQGLVTDISVPGEDDLLDARNLMERGDYNGAVRRATTAIEALVEHVLRIELLKTFDEPTVGDKLTKSQTDFPGRFRQWQKLSATTISETLTKSFDETRELRHAIVHKGFRISFEERGRAQKCVDTGRWLFNHIQADADRTQLREFTNMTVRAIARPTLAPRFPVEETPNGLEVRSYRSEFGTAAN